MWGLLGETLSEVKRHFLDMLRCFWPVLIYFAVAVAMLVAWKYWLDKSRHNSLSGIFSSLAVLVVFCAFLFSILAAPAAIQWHRLIITGQPTGWKMSRPSWPAFGYMLLISVLMFFFLILEKFFLAAWDDLLMPILGAFRHESSSNSALVWYDFIDSFGSRWFSHLMDFANPILGNMFVVLVYAIIFGGLYVRLPEMSLEPSWHGARKLWTKRERWNFLNALFLIFSISPIVSQVEHYIWLITEYEFKHNAQEPFLFSLLAGIVSMILAITLLSVAYKRNLKRLHDNSIVQTT
jgi:uncharacterized membrane protein YidH (DUF202 family)